MPQQVEEASPYLAPHKFSLKVSVSYVYSSVRIVFFTEDITDVGLKVQRKSVDERLAVFPLLGSLDTLQHFMKL